jgi:flagellar biosynthesis chaperone FliJ
MLPHKKMKQLDPIIKIKKHSLDLESAELFSIRQAKQEVIERMRQSQKTYMSSVDQLNLMRSKGMNQQASSLELGIDGFRNRWAALLAEARLLERREKIQLKMVMSLETELKAVENLHEKFEESFRKDLSVKDQASMDDFSQNRFFGRSK